MFFPIVTCEPSTTLCPSFTVSSICVVELLSKNKELSKGLYVSLISFENKSSGLSLIIIGIFIALLSSEVEITQDKFDVERKLSDFESEIKDMEFFLLF